MATQKGKKRKGLRKAKHCASYKLLDKLGLHRARRAKSQRMLFLKRLRKAVKGLTKELTDKMLNQFTSCKKCASQTPRRVFINTVAPLIERNLYKLDEVVYGGHCVRCGHKEKSASKA